MNKYYIINKIGNVNFMTSHLSLSEQARSVTITQALQYSTLVYYTILYYTILYYTILHYTILYYAILYYTLLCYAMTCYDIPVADHFPRRLWTSRKTSHRITNHPVIIQHTIDRQIYDVDR